MPNGKDRGGVPVCAPIFGPGEMVGLNQHGFARNTVWTVDRQTESQVKLSLDTPASQVEGLPPVYAGLGLELTVEVLENGLRETLTLRNIGIEPCTVSPAFHPYFPIRPGESAENAAVTIGGIDYRLSAEELSATRKVDSADASARLTTSQGVWTITGEGLPFFAIWSESPTDFVCVEPTESGYLTDAPASELQPNEVKSVRMTIVHQQT
jgi:D-hexose-6-phosphate mutarotase